MARRKGGDDQSGERGQGAEEELPSCTIIVSCISYSRRSLSNHDRTSFMSQVMKTLLSTVFLGHDHRCTISDRCM